MKHAAAASVRLLWDVLASSSFAAFAHGADRCHRLSFLRKLVLVRCGARRVQHRGVVCHATHRPGMTWVTVAFRLAFSWPEMDVSRSNVAVPLASMVKLPT